MEGIDLIRDFSVLLLAAGAAGLASKRLGLSVIVGYLVAGMIIGPHTPPFSLIIDENRIVALSQVGLVFLMFGIGLGLSLSKFARLGAGTLIATGLGAAAILVMTEIAGSFIGWTPLHAMFVAAMLMVSSSAVIAKVVTEQKRIVIASNWWTQTNALTESGWVDSEDRSHKACRRNRPIRAGRGVGWFRWRKKDAHEQQSIESTTPNTPGV